MSVYQIIFSPTGGTKAVSQMVASAWPESITMDLCDPAAEDFSHTFTGKDLCIFAVPAFEGRVPPVNLRRIQRLTGDHTPCIMVAVYGNRAIDDTLIELEDTLLSLGFLPFGAVSAVAQHSMLPMYGTGRPNQADKAQLEEFSQKLRRTYEQGSFAEPVSVPGKRPYIVIDIQPTYPSYDSGKCTHCGKCADLCPVGAIDHSDPGKVDTEACMDCMRCVKVCPTQARHLPSQRVEAICQHIGHLLEAPKENHLYL